MSPAAEHAAGAARRSGTGGGAGDPGRAAEAVRAWLDGRRPRIAVVLGSGLGGLAERFREARRLPYGEIPGWPAGTVEGHAGELVSGRLGGVQVLGQAGRAHLYEGHAPADLALPVRVMARLGVEVLLLSNAAGVVNRRFSPGELMLLADHLNLTFRSPLRGPVVEGEDRWPDLHECWDPDLRAAVRAEARERGIGLREGVYAAMLGPSYETPAEVRMLRRFGADAVGMSTVPAALAARATGVRCAAVSCLTNYAAGVTAEPLSHEEVLETTERVADAFQGLMEGAVRRIAGEEGWT